MPRILEPHQIPCSLWDPKHAGNLECGEGGLSLPPDFSTAYSQLLSEHNLLERAKEPEDATTGGSTGSAGDGGASEHFARRFSGSAARMQLCVLDPKNTLSNTSDSLLKLFAGCGVHLLDIPMGTGAASALLISAVAELRAKDVLPKNATEVNVIGGDIDDQAMRISSKLYEKLKPTWVKSGINTSLKCQPWDIDSDESTAALIEIWIKTKKENEKSAIVLANFSGFLWQRIGTTDKRKITEADFNIRQILIAATKLDAPLFWVEPAGKDSSGMFSWLSSKIGQRFKLIKPATAGSKKAKSLTISPVSALTFTARAEITSWEISKQ